MIPQILTTAHASFLRIQPMYIFPVVGSLSAYTHVPETQHYQNIYHQTSYYCCVPDQVMILCTRLATAT